MYNPVPHVNPIPQEFTPRYLNRYMPVERNEVDNGERLRLKRVIEETLDEESERNQEIK